MIFKDIKLEIKEVSNEGTFKGYAAAFGNEDLGGDIITPGAFTKTLTESKTRTLLWHHQTREPIGITEASENTKGLAVDGILNLEVQRGREVHSLMKQGAVKGMSIGYDAVRPEWKGGTRMLREIKLYEVSLVPFPMNPEAQVTSVKTTEDFESLLHELLTFKGGKLSEEQISLLEQVEKKLSSLRAAQALGADKQEPNAPDLFHPLVAQVDRALEILRR